VTNLWITTESSLLSTAFVTVSPDGCDDACVAGLVGSNGAITFTPVSRTPARGVLISCRRRTTTRVLMPSSLPRIARQGFFRRDRPRGDDFPVVTRPA
jgi:hypothetical protein